MEKRRGFVALLDVLGFSAMITGENVSERLEIYQSLLARAVSSAERSEVEAVAFSDSIVLTTKMDSPEHFVDLASRCSFLFGSMLKAGIPLRGAISVGTYFRDVMANSVFVAGRPIVDAFSYEKSQNWVGIMIAPSALQAIPGLDKKISISRGLEHALNRDEFVPRIKWAAAIQPAQNIPFSDGSSVYNGFAIVPRIEGYKPHEIYGDIGICRTALMELRAIAPHPAAQAKFKEPLSWLGNIESHWRTAAQEFERNPVVD